MRGLMLIVAAGIVALSVPALGRAYGWPVAPFDKPHPIRGAFDDPRVHFSAEPADSSSAFHFGIDIAAPDFTPVYAVEAGFAHAYADHVTVVGLHGRTFGYWHVAPAVHARGHVLRHQLIGYVMFGWGHVHFAESEGGFYRNPLRRGALTPFSDRTTPTVASIELVDETGAAVAPGDVHGTIGAIADAYDTPPLPPPPPWQLARLAPALIRWRIVRHDEAVLDWRTTIDFTNLLMPDALFTSIYAPGTSQNKANRPGRYRFWLVHSLDTSTLAPGDYALEVQAEDTRGNLGRGSLAFSVGSRSNAKLASR